MRAFRIAGLLLLLTSWSLSAWAQYFGRNKVQYESFNWRVLRTPHFEIYYYPEEEVAVRDAARMAERWYQRHSRTFLHEFGERKPIIFYADDADFHQTNAISGEIGEGTGGVTESIKERVIMPFTGIYRENDHVLGHELVHSFQYDIALNRSDSLTRFNLALLPLWLVEGMAEYLSLGRNDPHTAMWLRDAALRDDLPTIRQLTRDLRYFPYRYGQAYLAYIGGKYGDQAVTELYKLGGIVGVDTAIAITLGITPDSLSKEWIQAVKNTYLLLKDRTPPEQAGRKVLAPDLDAGEINLAPALSPDGRYVAFLSERDLFTIDLFVADAETGKVLRRLSSSASDPHFDAIRFINSSGSWSPDGQRFAFITFAQGNNEIAIWNLRKGKLERRIAVEGVGAIHNLAWSPDGRTIAFRGFRAASAICTCWTWRRIRFASSPTTATPTCSRPGRPTAAPSPSCRTGGRTAPTSRSCATGTNAWRCSTSKPARCASCGLSETASRSIPSFRRTAAACISSPTTTASRTSTGWT